MTKSWMKEYESFRDTGEAWALDLRLSLADIIIKHLRQNGWTQRQLAEKLGVREPVVSRLVHAEMNCTFETAGRILHALGVKADLVEPERITRDSAFTAPWNTVETEYGHHGTKECFSEKDTQEGRHKTRIADTAGRRGPAWAEAGIAHNAQRYTHSVG